MNGAWWSETTLQGSGNIITNVHSGTSKKEMGQGGAGNHLGSSPNTIINVVLSMTFD